MVQDQLLTTKLYIPHNPPYFVLRSELIVKMNKTLNSKFTSSHSCITNCITFRLALDRVIIVLTEI